MRYGALACNSTGLRCGGGSHLQDPTRPGRVMSVGVSREIGMRLSNLRMPQTRFGRLIRVSDSIFGGHFLRFDIESSNSTRRSGIYLPGF